MLVQDSATQKCVVAFAGINNYGTLGRSSVGSVWHDLLKTGYEYGFVKPRLSQICMSCLTDRPIALMTPTRSDSLGNELATATDVRTDDFCGFKGVHAGYRDELMRRVFLGKGPVGQPQCGKMGRPCRKASWLPKVGSFKDMKHQTVECWPWLARWPQMSLLCRWNSAVVHPAPGS